MTKKGFTLVEILAVIVILSVILVILVPMINSSRDNAKVKVYETMLSNIESAAVLYGQDNYRDIFKEPEHKKTIRVKNLIPDYYKADNDSTKDMVKDPRDSSKFLDEYQIEIKIDPNTRRVTAKVIEK